jgi:hypothetical protein
MNEENNKEQIPHEEDTQKQFTEKFDHLEVKVEGLKDGYRFTVKTDEEALKQQRRVGGSFINFAKQADKAGWRLPWFVRILLSFWSKYK